VEGADGGAIEPQQPPALEHAIDDGLRQILVVQYSPPGCQGLICRKDHRTMPPMALVDDVEEHVGGIGPVREVAHFVDDEDGRMGVLRQGVRQLAGAKRRREVVNERRRGREEGVEAILNRAVRERAGITA
jgi:hypothetical protein